jgi:hypothetical protein
LEVGIEDDFADAEVEGAGAFVLLPVGEAAADGTEEAARPGPGGGVLEALEHGLRGAVRCVARRRARRQEGIHVLAVDRHGSCHQVRMIRVEYEEGDGDDGNETRDRTEHDTFTVTRLESVSQPAAGGSQQHEGK